MASRSGGGKLLRKPKPGYDQEFTLPRGTSAAPIKQVKTSLKTKVKKKLKKIDRKLAPYDAEILYGGIYPAAGLGAATLGKIVKKSRKKKEKKQRTETRKKQRGMSSGGSVNSRAIAKKYFRGGLV